MYKEIRAKRLPLAKAKLIAELIPRGRHLGSA
jgi:hypothetical protein